MSATRLRQDLWLLDAKVQANAFELYRQGCAHLFDITLMSPEARFYNRLEGYNLDSVVLACPDLCSFRARMFCCYWQHI